MLRKILNLKWIIYVLWINKTEPVTKIGIGENLRYNILLAPKAISFSSHKYS